MRTRLILRLGVALTGVAPAVRAVVAQQPIGAATAASARGTALDSLAGERCGRQPRGSVALVGIVRAAESTSRLDSAAVFVQWLDLTMDRRGVTRKTVTRVSSTEPGGAYVVCGVPAGATLLAWAERGNATTGAIALQIGGVPAQLDLVLDLSMTAFQRFMADLSADSAGASAGDVRRPPTPGGTTRYRALVADEKGRPIAGARARILGHAFVQSDARGALTIDSLPRGSETLEVQAVGYLPDERVVEVRANGAPPDSIVLTSLKSVLDTIRVSAGRDVTGFEARRKERRGQFITVADIVREEPENITTLLRTRDDVHYVIGGDGAGRIEIGIGREACSPLILIDGFPVPPAAVVAPGMATLNWAVHPEEIGGVEIYTKSGQIPAEFLKWARMGPPCGAIAFWTRAKLRIPPAIKNDRQ